MSPFFNSKIFLVKNTQIKNDVPENWVQRNMIAAETG